MTLICSVLTANFLAISDILLSSPDEDTRRVILPLHVDAVSHAAGGYSAAGVAQKAVVFGRTLILWAGRKIVADAIIKECFIRSGEGQDRIDMFSLIDRLGLTEAEKHQVQIIYHYVASGHVYRQGHGIETNRAGVSGLMSGGTGQFDFIDNLSADISRSPLRGSEADIAAWLTRPLMSLISEAYARRTLDFSYGGWYEIVLADTDGFRKVPLAVKIWTVRSDGGIAASNPVWYSWYLRNDLHVCRFWMDAPEGKPKVMTSVITDPLARGAVNGLSVLPAICWRPEIQFHVLINPVTGLCRAKMITVPPYPFNLEVADGQIEMLFEAEFVSLIAELMAAGSDAIEIGRPYGG